MTAIGTVVVEIPDGVSISGIKALVHKAMDATPAGRILSVVFPLPQNWTTSKPIEATITLAVMGSPSRRATDPQWMFFGNLGVRIYRCRGRSQKVNREIAILMFRRSGPKAYERRLDVSEVTVAASRIEVSHPVFTRDVANNVWHLPLRGHKGHIRRRLSMLLTWSDEKLLLIGPKSQVSISHQIEDMDTALVGVPRKLPYQWIVG